MRSSATSGPRLRPREKSPRTRKPAEKEGGGERQRMSKSRRRPTRLKKKVVEEKKPEVKN
jgi:hypothetical protein